jgi:hypothetical protein
MIASERLENIEVSNIRILMRTSGREKLIPLHVG